MQRTYSYAVQLEPNQGVKKETRLPPLLNSNYPPTVSYHIFIDNYFTSFRLLTHLGVNNNQATDALIKKMFSQKHCHWEQTAT